MEIYVGRKVNMNPHFIRVNQNNLEINRNFPCPNTLNNFKNLQAGDILIYINNDQVLNLQELSTKSNPSEIEIYKIDTSPSTSTNSLIVQIEKIFSDPQIYRTLQNIVFNELQKIPHVFFDPSANNYFERIFNISKYSNNLSAHNLIEIFNYIIKIIDSLQFLPQTIIQGPPGTGKTRLAKMIANFIVNGTFSDKIQQNQSQIKIIQFHPGYSYDDFIRGMEVSIINTRKQRKLQIQQNQLNYAYIDKILVKIANQAQKDLQKPYFLIIDEINRADLNSLLGELIYALEYRGEDIELLYPDSSGKRTFSLPPNLYIIGTMNTADRSTESLDYAIRRRFAFHFVPAQKGFAKNQQKFQEANDIVKEYIAPDYDYEDFAIGHSYFIGDDREIRKNIAQQVKPMLKEYLKDGILDYSKKDEILEKIRNL